MGLLRSQKKLDPPYLRLTLTHHAIFVKKTGLMWQMSLLDWPTLQNYLFLEMMRENQNVNKENLILFC